MRQYAQVRSRSCVLGKAVFRQRIKSGHSRSAVILWFDEHYQIRILSLGNCCPGSTDLALSIRKQTS